MRLPCELLVLGLTLRLTCDLLSAGLRVRTSIVSSHGLVDVATLLRVRQLSCHLPVDRLEAGDYRLEAGQGGGRRVETDCAPGWLGPAGWGPKSKFLPVVYVALPGLGAKCGKHAASTAGNHVAR